MSVDSDLEEVVQLRIGVGDRVDVRDRNVRYALAAFDAQVALDAGPVLGQLFGQLAQEISAQGELIFADLDVVEPVPPVPAPHGVAASVLVARKCHGAPRYALRVKVADCSAPDRRIVYFKWMESDESTASASNSFTSITSPSQR